MIKKCSILCLFLLNFVVYWNETGWVLETGFKVHASFGAEMEGGPGNNDWGCEGSVSGGMECDEIVITPNPCDLLGADPCECFGIGCDPCLEPDADLCECYGTGCDEDPCENGEGDPCECFYDCDNIDMLLPDCAGVPGGSAYTDDCGNCVGGDTGQDPCQCQGEQCLVCGGYRTSESILKSSSLGNSCRVCNCVLVSEEECEKINAARENLQNFISGGSSAYLVGTDLEMLKDYAVNSSDEWARAFQNDPDNGWYGSSEGFVSGNNNSVSVSYTCHTGVTAHTHPDGTELFGPSALDLQTVIARSVYINTNSEGDCEDGSYLGEYIVAGVAGEIVVYFLYVPDAGNVANFAGNNTNYVNPTTYNFEENSNIGKTYKSTYDEFIDRGYGDNAAHIYAFAYVLDAFNIGIILFKVSGDNYFNPILVGKDDSQPLLNQFYMKIVLCNPINNN